MDRKILADWLSKNKDVLSISGIENEIGCPKTTLQKVIQGKKNIPRKWIDPLKKLINERLVLKNE